MNHFLNISCGVGMAWENYLLAGYERCIEKYLQAPEISHCNQPLDELHL